MTPDPQETPGLGSPDLESYVIYRCIVGSRAYGLDRPGSDTDTRGIYLPPADLEWSLDGVPEQLEDRDSDTVFWELEKFLNLALKANPNILECLYTPEVEFVDPIAEELLARREIFLSRLVYETTDGYARSQFRKMEQDFRQTGTFRGKHAMHLIRLLLTGIVMLEEARVPVRVEDHREDLLAIRNGERSFEEVDRWRLALHDRFDRALETTRLPEKPDREAANEILLRARRARV